jgi:hypothetical protein
VALGLGDSPAYVAFHPGPLVSHRVFLPRRDGA